MKKTVSTKISHASIRTLSAALLVAPLLLLNACGQKGPLELERPQVVQEEEIEETI